MMASSDEDQQEIMDMRPHPTNKKYYPSLYDTAEELVNKENSTSDKATKMASQAADAAKNGVNTMMNLAKVEQKTKDKEQKK